jgi:outer membrane biogenesis lipoprotein LolB
LKKQKNLSNKITKSLTGVIKKAPYPFGYEVVFIFVFFFLVGCQSSVEKAPPHFSKETITSGYIFNRLQARADQIYSVKSFARTTFIGKEFKQSFRQTLIIKGNGSIRVDTYGLFGQAMGVFIRAFGRMQFLDPAKNKIYSGSDVKRMLRKMLGTQIDFNEHLRIFVGHIPNFEFLQVESSRLDSDRTKYILKAKDTKRSGEVLLHIDSTTLLPIEMTRFEEGQKRYFVEWQEYKKIGSIDWPHLITLEFPARQELLRIKYKDPTLNDKISPDTFKLTPTTISK